VSRGCFARLSVRGVAAVTLPALVVVVGCSAGDHPRSAGTNRMPAAEPELIAATTSANPTAADDRHRTIRPVPDVVSKPRPFRLPPRIVVQPAGLPTAASATAPGLVATPATPARLADVPPAAAADQPVEGEIRDMLRSYLRAFNQHDAAALAAHWSPAGESMDLDSGDVTVGRDAVRDVFAALFAEDDAATIDIDIASIRPVRDDVAVVDGVTRVAFSEGRPAGSRFSAVVVREGGRWLLESVREAAQPQPEGTQAARPLDALSWLVGSWEDAGAGVTAGTQCFWSAGRACPPSCLPATRLPANSRRSSVGTPTAA